MLSEFAWDRRGVYRQLVRDAYGAFASRGPCAFVIDESGSSKKGEKSAGVARQWNGRLGKTETARSACLARSPARAWLPSSMKSY